MLLDHFHAPLSQHYGWKGFHNQWASVLAADLNERLPPGWRAEPDVEFGIEIDVGVLDETGGDGAPAPPNMSWQPPAPTLTLPFLVTTDVVEIRVINHSYGPSLMGAIELVSPANKDRPEHREAFVAKCVSILSQGAGLIVIDVVTERRANLHAALLERLNELAQAKEGELYAAAYRTRRGDNGQQAADSLDIWHHVLRVSESLPTMPLYLRVGAMMPVDFDATYRTTCRQLRIPVVDPGPGAAH